MIIIKTMHTSAQHIIYPRAFLGFSIYGNQTLSINIAGVGVVPIKSINDPAKAQGFCVDLLSKIEREPESEHIIDADTFNGI